VLTGKVFSLLLKQSWQAVTRWSNHRAMVKRHYNDRYTYGAS